MVHIVLPWQLESLPVFTLGPWPAGTVTWEPQGPLGHMGQQCLHRPAVSSLAVGSVTSPSPRDTLWDVPLNTELAASFANEPVVYPSSL